VHAGSRGADEGGNSVLSGHASACHHGEPPLLAYQTYSFCKFVMFMKKPCKVRYKVLGGAQPSGR
jgi:hypothetical protein